jgi:uncharacterized protein (TIGR02328 family)
MRLWAEQLITRLPRAQLLGQHRECAALRGNGWGKRHATVDYVFTYDPMRLVAYHRRIMAEMARRGYRVTETWLNAHYRGKLCAGYDVADSELMAEYYGALDVVYPEHDAEYVAECERNLNGKGIAI